MTALLEELARTPALDPDEVLQREIHAGSVIGRFELLREIGRGGCGVVYEARDLELGRLVAVKAIRPGDRSAAELRKKSLRSEAEAAAQLSHPNIVTLHDFGSSDGVPYLILELLRGETLEDRLARGPLPVREAVGVAVEVAKALAHAHGTGVVHRDLKPSNVFLTSDGVVKVLDFGLAYIFGGRVPVSGGTPDYMAPEQRRTGEVDERSDVFALGVILHAALTGALPFQHPASPGSRPAPRMALREAPALGELVVRMLAEDPVRRPRDAREVLSALIAVQRELGGEAAEARRAPALPGGRRWRMAVALAAALGATLGIGALVLRRARPGPTGDPGASRTISSVAVLPFADMSPGKDQEYFSDGLSEEILNALAHVPGLHVAGRTSSFSFKGRDGDLRSIGQKLNVASVLEGSVRKAGSRVRITAQLVGAADGFHLWSQTFDRELTDVFAVQDEIAGAVVKALKVHVHPDDAPPTTHHWTADVEVYRQYLLGRHFWNMLSKGENNQRAVKANEQALALDPSYAPAWAGLALAVFAVGDDAGTAAAEQEGCRRGLAAVERALALDPQLSEAHSARAQLRAWCSWDWAGARADVERALTLSPGDVDARRRDGILHLLMGRGAEAVTSLREAVAIDPLVPLSWRWLGIAEMTAGHPDAAREAVGRALEIAPGDPYGTYLLSVAFLLDGQPAAALSSIERSRDREGADRLTALALAQHDLGHAEASERALAALRAKLERGDTDAPSDLARYHAWVGEPDRALEFLERAYGRHDIDATFIKADPLLRKLRGQPRYEALLRKMNLPLD